MKQLYLPPYEQLHRYGFDRFDFERVEARFFWPIKDEASDSSPRRLLAGSPHSLPF